MKGKWIFAAILAAALYTVAAMGAWATDRQAGDCVRITGQTANDDLELAGRSVDVEDSASADVAAVGATVAIRGPVRGDVLAAGATVLITSAVRDDLRVAGGTVTVDSSISDNALIFGGTIILGRSASIGHDATIAGGMVEVRGPIKGDLFLSAGEARLGSSIGKGAEVYADQLILEPGAAIGGDLVVHSPRPPEISPKARVSGKVTHIRTQPPDSQLTFGGWLGWQLYKFLSLLLVGGVILAISPQWAERVATAASKSTGLSALIGFAALICVPVAAILLMVTLIGIPLAVLLMGAYALVFMMSGAFAAYPLGRWMASRVGRSSTGPYWKMTIGAFVVSIMTGLPIVGWIALLGVLMVGGGALLLERRDYQRIPTPGP